MTKSLRIAIGQLNLAVGDIAGNTQKLLNARQWAVEQNADLIVFPELSVTGYPPEDMVLKEEFVRMAMQSVQDLADATEDGKTAMLVSSPWKEEGGLYNAAILVTNGRIDSVQYKHDLPNYGVFDEKRVFNAGELPKLTLFRGVKLGIMICEDMWNLKVCNALSGADILINVSASPFEVGKHEKRVKSAGENIDRLGVPMIYVNHLCGQDDLVFDGDSFVLSHEKELQVRLPRTGEALELTEWSYDGSHWICRPGTFVSYDSEEQVIYQAMMLGLRDYVSRNGFPGVILGMSGGIDSALTAAVAVDALGKDKVRLVMMPSRYTSQESVDDAQACSDALGVTLEHVPIDEMMCAFEDNLSPHVGGKVEGLTEENLQSRIRGVTLMAFSNQSGYMVVATGNKSEMSMGYATLYGDMCGGYSVLKDVYKMQVYALSKWRNSHVPETGKGVEGVVLPANILSKAPTAELRPDQKDEDSLPPYSVLDPILERLIERGWSIGQVVKDGFDKELVEKVSTLLYRAEYKRRQSPPGVKISERPFSRDRRYPITNRFVG